MTITQCNERRYQLCAQLRETLEPVEDGYSSVCQLTVLNILKMNASEKSGLSQAIRHAFPLSTKKKVYCKEGQQELILKQFIAAHGGYRLFSVT